MLYYSEKRLIPVNVNMIVLQGNDDAYYYVHRSLYDQAVILSDRYEDNLPTLRNLIGTTTVTEAISLFCENTPKPINILGNFLSMIDSYQELPEDIETLCGVIHVMSKVLNLRKIINVPKETRASMGFSLSIVDEYELSWGAFFQESIPYSEELFLLGAKAYVGNNTNTNLAPQIQTTVPDTEPVSEEREEIQSMVEEFSDEDWDDFWDDPEKMAAFLGKSEDDEEEKAPVEIKPATVAEPVVEQKDDAFSLLSKI